MIIHFFTGQMNSHEQLKTCCIVFVNMILGTFLLSSIFLHPIFGENDIQDKLISNPITNPFPYHLFNEDNDRIPNQYIIYLKDSNTIEGNAIGSQKLDPIQFYNKELRDTGSELLYSYKYVAKGIAVKLANEEILESLKKNPLVKYIGEDRIISTKPFIEYIGKDTVRSTFTEQELSGQIIPKGIDRVDGDLNSFYSDSNSINTDIAVLDTGIDLDHDDLNVYQEKTFIPGTTTANDDHGHGTHIAGVAAAKDNSLGTVGIAPGARLWAIKVLESSGNGEISTLVKGLDYIAKNARQIDVAVLSLGCECKSDILDMAIDNAIRAGITVVVAAGNEGKNAHAFSPANNPNVIAVSAIIDTDGKCGGNGPATSYGSDDTLASFSNYGDIVDIAAPGVDIYSTFKNNSYASLTGTSMAAPHVAGAAALYLNLHQGASPEEVKKYLISSGSEISDSCDNKGHGYFSGDRDDFHEPLLYVGSD